jgi:hypothetical protein
MSQQLANLNPEGWQGSPKTWGMFHAVDTNQVGLALAVCCVQSMRSHLCNVTHL